MHASESAGTFERASESAGAIERGGGEPAQRRAEPLCAMRECPRTGGDRSPPGESAATDDGRRSVMHHSNLRTLNGKRTDDLMIECCQGCMRENRFTREWLYDIALFKMANVGASRVSARQLALTFPNGWGGARKGAGRKARLRSSTPHRTRPVQRAAEPVHVTLRARLAVLRSQFVFPTVRLALVRAARRDPARFRVVHFSVQGDHVHLVVEAENRRALSSGMSGVAIRIARYVNDLLSRRGPLWAERWHGRALTSPREVRNAILYVLANFRKHATRALPAGIDPCSSACCFDGFREWHPASGAPPPFAERVRWQLPAESSVALERSAARDFEARTWLARTGWRRHGLVGLAERPSAPRGSGTARDRDAPTPCTSGRP